MTRKKIFLIPALFLCSIFSFLTFSCSSGMSDESGEVSFTFTEPMLRKVMSRDAGSGDDFKIPDWMSGLEKYGLAPKNVKFQFAGTGSRLAESESPTTAPFILYLYDPGNYELYSLNLIQSISENFGSNPSQIISSMGGGFSEIFKSALVSKGDWTSSANYIDITEKQYRSAASDNLLEVPSTTPPTSIRFLLDEITFNFDTKAGYHITFYNTGNNSDDYDSKDYSPKIRVELTSKGKTYIKESEIVQVEYAALGHARIESPDMPEGQKKTYLLLAYSDGSYKIQEFEDGKLLSIVSEGRWKMGLDEEQRPLLYIYEDGKSEEQIIHFEDEDGFKVMLNETPVRFSESDADEELSDFKYLPVSVSFKNLPRGAKAKVYAEIFANEPHGKRISLASGESSDFIIESNTVVNVRMKLIDIGYKPGEPENPSEEELVSPGGTITAVYNGTGANGINEKTPYQLVIFNDTEYAIYEVVDNQGKIESKGAPICFGTCSFTSGEGDMFSFDFKEKAYLKDGSYTKSSDGGNHKSNTDIHLHSASALEFVFYLVKDIPASGTIASDNRALLISLDYDPETISLDNGVITFVAAKADGSKLTEDEAKSITWTAKILYKGNDINSFNEEIDYYLVKDNCLSWNDGTPLPSAANYQIYVTATWPVDEEAPVIKMNNSQTFDIYIQ